MEHDKIVNMEGSIMEKMIDGKKYYLYTSLSRELKKIYQGEIYNFLCRLGFEYQGFRSWYKGLYTREFELKYNREIIICEDQFRIIGVAILKNDLKEKKICTLRVARECQHQGIGHNLVELSMHQLNTDKPMITLHKSKLNQFEKLLAYYNFVLEQTQKHYYSIFSTELVFNGLLPEKELLFNKIELMDMEKIYRDFVHAGKKNLEEYMDACIRCWYNREQMRQIHMFKA